MRLSFPAWSSPNRSAVREFPPVLALQLYAIVGKGTSMDHSADPDRFTTDSDDAYESQEAASSPTSPFGRWLAAVVSLGASDLLLVQGAPPCMRIDGEVRKVEPNVLDGSEIEARL